MTYEVIWDELALNAAVRFLKDDPEGLRQVFASVDLLGIDPAPVGARAYGADGMMRIHIGFYRVIYRIVEDTVTVLVVHVGRAKPAG